MLRRFAQLFVLTAILSLAPAAARAGGLVIGETGPGFSLKTPTGESLSLKDLIKAEGTRFVIVEIASVDCPFTLRADTEFVPMMEKLAGEGVRAAALFPIDAESGQLIQTYAAKSKIGYAIARDPGGKTAKAWGAVVTPTFYVFDRASVLRYRGGLTGLREAIAALLAGRKVVKVSSPAVGCRIEQKPAKDGARNPPDGRSPPAELTAEAAEWLAKLAAKLESEDPVIQRSAMAAITSMGPGALPHLRRMRGNAEGRMAEQLDAAIRAITDPPPPRPRRRPGGEATMLEIMLRALEQNIDVTPEQRKKIQVGFADLRDLENEIRQARRTGQRDGLREKWRRLLDKAQEVVKGVLTEAQWERWENLRKANVERARERERPGERGGTDGDGDR